MIIHTNSLALFLKPLKLMRIIYLFFCLLFSHFLGFPQTQDPSFSAGLFKSGTVNSLHELTNGQILVGGDFIKVDFQWTGSVVRLNADGTLDTSFQPKEKTTGDIQQVIAAEDQSGRLLVSGFNLRHGGEPISPVLALDVNGNLLSEFEIPYDDFKFITRVHLTRDNQILIAGVSAEDQSFLVKMDWDGQLDESFEYESSPGHIKALVELLDGKLLVGSQHTSNITNPFKFRRLMRIEANGTRDTTFSLRLSRLFNSNSVDQLYYQNENSIYFGYGGLDILFNINRDGEEQKDIVKLPSLHQAISTIADDRLIIGSVSDFNSYENTGQYPPNSIFRMGANNDEIDTLTTGQGFFGVTRIALELDDGSILVGGRFSKYKGSEASGLIKLLPETFTRDPQFNPVIQSAGLINALIEQEDGSLIVGGYFDYVDSSLQYNLAKLQPNGSHDPSFEPNLHPNYQVYSLHSMKDGRIVVGASYWSEGDSLSSVNGLTYLSQSGEVLTSGFDDRGFDLSTSSSFQAVNAVDQSGRIYLNGSFKIGSKFIRTVRLDSAGRLDTSFLSKITRKNGEFTSISNVVVQDNGKVILGGRLLFYDGYSTTGLLQLDQNDQVDFDFVTTVGGENPAVIRKISNGKLYALDPRSDNEGLNTRFLLYKLQANGLPVSLLDFDVVSFGPPPNVNSFGFYSIVVLPEDRLYIDGNLGTIDGEKVSFPVILDSTGNIDNSYNLEMFSFLRNVVFSERGDYFAFGQTERASQLASVGVIKFTDNLTSSVNRIQMEEGLKILPNPIENQLFLQFDSIVPKLPMSYRIFDLSGRLVMNGLLKNEYPEITIGHLSRGGYFLFITDARKKMWMERIVRK